MTEIDSTRILTPLSPTYMPYFPPHRSPLHSSSNTRQRDDYESLSPPSSPSPQVLVTLTDDQDGQVSTTDRFIEGYPAWELPFASEPALEGELEQGLPPLKKLKPDQHSPILASTPTNPHNKNPTEGIILLGTVKGILTKRESPSTTPHSPPASSPICPDSCFPPWSHRPGLGLVATTTNISTPHQSSTPLSRRSSSGASSACAGSLKAVRFASGHGFPNGLGPPGALETSLPILPGQVEGPVAAIMYLTHSAEAYDRSPIIVENGLRLPPRAKPDDEDDADDGPVVALAEEETATLKPSSTPLKPPSSPQKKRRTKINVELMKISPASPLCTSPEVLSPRADSEHETSIVIKPSSSLSVHRSYREIEEVDEEEEDEGASRTIEDGEEENDESNEINPPNEDDNSEDEDDDHHHHLRIPASDSLHASSSSAQWGLGKWSSGEVLESCDALGGF